MRHGHAQRTPKKVIGAHAGLVVMLCVGDMLTSVRVTADVAAWHALPVWLTCGDAEAVAVWGLRVAVAGQPLFRDEIQEAGAVAP